MGTLNAVADRPGVQTGTIDPFHIPKGSDPSSDTLPGVGSELKTVFAPTTNWQSVTISSLSRVRDLLDSLEAHGVNEREVVTLSDESFLVRWR